MDRSMMVSAAIGVVSAVGASWVQVYVKTAVLSAEVSTAAAKVTQLDERYQRVIIEINDKLYKCCAGKASESRGRYMPAVNSCDL